MVRALLPEADIEGIEVGVLPELHGSRFGGIAPGATHGVYSACIPLRLGGTQGRGRRVLLAHSADSQASRRYGYRSHGPRSPMATQLREQKSGKKAPLFFGSRSDLCRPGDGG